MSTSSSAAADDAIIYNGPKFRLEWAVSARGNRPGRNFFDGLSESEQTKLTALFRRLGDHGRIMNQEKFKSVEPGLFEFKSYQTRFLGDFRPGKRFVLAIGLTKKRNKHRRTDLERAQRVLVEHDRQKGEDRS